MDNFKIIIIDDNIDFANYIAEVAQDINFECRVAESVDSFFEQEKFFKPDLIISDVVMPKIDGIEFAQILSNFSNTPPVIFMTGFDNGKYLENSESLAQGYGLTILNTFNKPIKMADLKIILRSAENEILNSDNKIQKEMIN